MGAKIIGLVGFIGCGKGSVTNLLESNHGFKTDSFAKSVKDATATIFGWDRRLLEGDTKESREFREKPDSFWSEAFNTMFTPRQALQLMGTEAGRNVFHPDLWVLTVKRRLEKQLVMDAILRQETNVVISDVRFPNEIKMIRDMGGKVVRIRRGDEPEWYKTAMNDNLQGHGRMYTMYPEVHASEWSWIGADMDAVMDNNGSIDDLPHRVENLLHILYNENVEDTITINTEAW